MYFPIETTFYSITLSVANKIQKEKKPQNSTNKRQLFHYLLIFEDHGESSIINNNNGPYIIVKTKNEL